MALTGRATEAGTTFRRLIDLWDGVMLPEEINEVRALYAATLPDDPAAQHESGIALRWIEESGAAGLFGAWKAGLQSAQPVPTSYGVSHTAAT